MRWLGCLVFLAGLTILSSGCAKKQNVQEEEKIQEAVPVMVSLVTRTPFTEYGTYYGRVGAINEAHIICYSGGRVERVMAREGSLVKAGASLASVDSEKAISLLETARLQEKIALRNLEQTRKHFENGNASALAVDQAELAFLGAQNSRIDAQKNHRGALAVTPVSGMVTNKFVNLYQEIPPGTPLFSVAQTGTMKIEVALVESDVAAVKVGSEAEVTVDMYPDRVWSGTVKVMAQAASPESKKFTAEIHVDNRDGFLKTGVTGRVRIALRNHLEAVVIPVHAVQTEGVRSSVMVVDEQNRARRRYITPGAQSDSTLLVVVGLNHGERLVIAGQHLVTDGGPVVASGNIPQTQDNQ